MTKVCIQTSIEVIYLSTAISLFDLPQEIQWVRWTLIHCTLYEPAGNPAFADQVVSICRQSSSCPPVDR